MRVGDNLAVSLITQSKDCSCHEKNNFAQVKPLCLLKSPKGLRRGLLPYSLNGPFESKVLCKELYK